jgi:hypothetical protein
MILNEQELRNCVYRGPFNDLLAGLEKDATWRKAKGGDEPEGRFKEREIILRFFAFANRLANYTGNLKRFLSEYMGQYAPHEPQDLSLGCENNQSISAHPFESLRPSRLDLRQ